MSIKGGLQKASPKTPAAKRNIEKVFKNPDLPPPLPLGGFTKLGQGQPLPLPMHGNRSAANIASLLKHAGGPYSNLNIGGGNWSQPGGISTMADVSSSVKALSSMGGITSSSDLYSPMVSISDRVGSSVSSSSDNVDNSSSSAKSPHLSTSTPSSPVESPSGMLGEATGKSAPPPPPLIIPTEAILTEQANNSSTPTATTMSSSPLVGGKGVDSSAQVVASSRLVSADSSSSAALAALAGATSSSSEQPSQELFSGEKSSLSVKQQKLSDNSSSTPSPIEPTKAFEAKQVFFPLVGKGPAGENFSYSTGSGSSVGASVAHSISLPSIVNYDGGSSSDSNMDSEPLIGSSDA